MFNSNWAASKESKVYVEFVIPVLCIRALVLLDKTGVILINGRGVYTKQYITNVDAMTGLEQEINRRLNEVRKLIK